MIKCPHSVYFFRGDETDFRYFSFDDFGGDKRGNELKASPNPLLTLANEGKVYRTTEDFSPNSNFIWYDACEYPFSGRETGVTYYIKRTINYTNYYYEQVPDGHPMDTYTQYYTWANRKIKKETYVQVVCASRGANPVFKFAVFEGNMAHSLLDWGLVPLGRPMIAPPQQKLQVVDIPGMDGVLDMSNSLTRYPVFNNRQGTLQFAILHEQTDTPNSYRKMLNYLQGTDVKMILEDDPEYFYQGRVYVDNIDPKNDGHHSEVTLGYDLYPYKKSIYSTFDDWNWDTFNFDDDYIDQKLCMNIYVDKPFATSGDKPDPSKQWDSKHTLTIDFSDVCGQQPIHPYAIVAGSNDEPIYAQLWNTDLYGKNWVGSDISYYDKYLNSNKYKWTNDVSVFELLDTEQGNKYTTREIRYMASTEKDALAKKGSKFRKLVFCTYTSESVCKMRFKGKGYVSIYFRKGML